MILLIKTNLCFAICASPALVLTKTNVIEGKKVTCYPENGRKLSRSVQIIKIKK